jgi:hypothetical protein
LPEIVEPATIVPVEASSTVSPFEPLSAIRSPAPAEVPPMVVLVDPSR